jgi:hypothetical protein
MVRRSRRTEPIGARRAAGARGPQCAAQFLAGRGPYALLRSRPPWWPAVQHAARWRDHPAPPPISRPRNCAPSRPRTDVSPPWRASSTRTTRRRIWRSCSHTPTEEVSTVSRRASGRGVQSAGAHLESRPGGCTGRSTKLTRRRPARNLHIERRGWRWPRVLPDRRADIGSADDHPGDGSAFMARQDVLTSAGRSADTRGAGPR